MRTQGRACRRYREKSSKITYREKGVTDGAQFDLETYQFHNVFDFLKHGLSKFLSEFQFSQSI